jgi:spore maturation protein SpmA
MPSIIGLQMYYQKKKRLIRGRNIKDCMHLHIHPINPSNNIHIYTQCIYIYIYIHTHINTSSLTLMPHAFISIRRELVKASAACLDAQ